MGDLHMRIERLEKRAIEKELLARLSSNRDSQPKESHHRERKIQRLSDDWSFDRATNADDGPARRTPAQHAKPRCPSTGPGVRAADPAELLRNRIEELNRRLAILNGAPGKK
jgi:hypothetical protein